MAPGLRERKKAETRRALASAALRLARELGPDGVTVEAIAEAAGVSPRTFFNYFASKDDAIVNVSPTEQSMLVAALCDRPEDEPPLDALRAMVQAAAQRFAEDADEMLVRHRLAQEPPSLAMRRSARFAEVGDLFAPLSAAGAAAYSIRSLLELADKDERDHGEGDLPYPPEHPKMPGEPKRVQPSRDADRPR